MSTDAFAEVNGQRLHYVTAGQGQLLLFLHGFPEFWYAWKRQVEAFSGERQAVALDMRGYNLSSKPAAVEAYRLDELVEDVRELADQLGQQRFALVGHDWGGVVAWAFAQTHPDRLDRLIIVNAPHPAIFQRELRDNPAQQRASRYMLTLRSDRAERLLAENNYAWLQRAVIEPGMQAGYFTEADRAAYLEAWSQAGALTGMLNYYRAMAPGGGGAGGAAAPPAPAVITVPTLVLWGERDEYLLPGNLDGLEAYVHDLTVQRLPDGSHWVIHEQPDRVNAAIGTFIGRT